MTEQEETERGEYIAKVFGLKPNAKGFYVLGDGFGTKTALGLFRSVNSIVNGEALQRARAAQEKRKEKNPMKKSKLYKARSAQAGQPGIANVSFYASSDDVAKRKADKHAHALGITHTPRTITCEGKVIECITTGCCASS